MKELVIFDVDGTIIKGQSQRLFLGYLFLTKRIGGFFYFKLLLWFVFYRLGIVKDPRKPMKYAFSFMKGRSTNEIALWVHNFFDTTLKKYIYSDAVELIKNHQKAGREVILVSNSMRPIIKEIANYFDIKNYFSTNLDTDGDVYNGEILDDAYGDNKVNITTQYAQKNGYDLSKSWAYSDHISDQKLLSIVGNPVATNPSTAMMSFAKENNWSIVKFSKLER